MLDLPLFDTFKKDEIAIFPQVDQPTAVTISEIKQEYVQLGKTLIGDDEYETNRWTLGTQESLPDKTIKSRTYSELTFDDNAVDFDFVTGGDARDFGSSTYWRVIHRFTETEHFSNSGTELQNFKIWQKEENRWQQEIIYLHEEVGTLEWNRDQISVPTEGGGLSGEASPPTCPTDTPAAPPGETGQSAAFATSTQPLTCARWESIPVPFYVTFDVGEALGGVIETNGPVTYIIKKADAAPRNGTPLPEDEATGSGSVSNPIRLNKRYIEVYFNSPTRSTPTYVRLRRFGKENFRVSLPFQRDNEPEFLEHAASVPQAQRYKPPGRSDLPDNFWNDGAETELQGYGFRLGSGGGVATND